MTEDFKAEMIRRLKRIEGQARGIQKMVEEERDCQEVLVQLNAINEAVRSASRLMAEEYAVECMQAPSKRSREAVAAMMDVITRMPR
jgi:DNA-binding FrmR family transcriptional regulator